MTNPKLSQVIRTLQRGHLYLNDALDAGLRSLGPQSGWITYREIKRPIENQVSDIISVAVYIHLHQKTKLF